MLDREDVGLALAVLGEDMSAAEAAELAGTSSDSIRHRSSGRPHARSGHTSMVARPQGEKGALDEPDGFARVPV